MERGLTGKKYPPLHKVARTYSASPTRELRPVSLVGIGTTFWRGKVQQLQFLIEALFWICSAGESLHTLWEIIFWCLLSKMQHVRRATTCSMKPMRFIDWAHVGLRSAAGFTAKAGKGTTHPTAPLEHDDFL